MLDTGHPRHLPAQADRGAEKVRRARGLIPGLVKFFSEFWEVDMLHVDEDDMLARVLRASDVSEIVQSPSVALGADKTSHLFDLSESRESG